MAATPIRWPTDEAEAQLGVRLLDVLVDLAVGEAGERGVLGGDQRLGLGRPLGRRQPDGFLGQGQPGPRVASSAVRPVARAVYHLPTPIWTSRNRAPLTAWPTWPTWPGSPLPQFGVPSIR